MARRTDDDLFKESTMSFGEHLEELRGALFRSVIAIAIGFGFGLYVGDWVVKKLKDPLEAALVKYYQDQAVEDFEARIKEREDNGEKIPAELKDRKYIERLVDEDQMLFDEAYIDPAAVLDGLKSKYPDQFSGITIPPRNLEAPPKKTDLVRMLLWHRVADDHRIRVKGLAAQEAFMILMKAALISGFVFASPAVFYFIWQFVASGLYIHERWYVYVFLPFSLGLFFAGVGLAFFFVFPPVLDFFFYFNKQMGIDPDPRISEWMSFVLLLPLAFGVSFQLPLVMLFLERIGVFSVSMYLKSWRMAILIMAITAAVITPTGDPQTMAMLLIPLTFLYFGGILLCKWFPSNRDPNAPTWRWPGSDDET